MTTNPAGVDLQAEDLAALEVAALALTRIADIPSAPPQVALAAFDAVTQLASLGVNAGIETGPATVPYLLLLALRELAKLSPTIADHATVAVVRGCCEYALREAG